MVKLLYFFDVLSQGQSKILAIISAIVKSAKKIFSQDFNRGQASEYTVYASGKTPLIQD